jgi:hypothetical protein
LEVTTSGPGGTLSFMVRARTHQEAEELVWRLAERAFEAASPASAPAEAESVYVYVSMEHIEPASATGLS